MKTIKRPEIFLPLLYVMACLPWIVFRNAPFFPVVDHLGLTSLNQIGPYRGILLVLVIALIIYSTARYFRKKIISTEKQYYFLFDNHPLPMGIFDVTTLRFVAVNRAALERYGYTEREFLALELKDITANDAPDANDTLPQDAKNSRISKHRKKNGEIILAEISSQEVFFKNKNCKLLLARDASDLLNAREEKRIAVEESLQQKNFTNYILENFPVEVAIFNKDHEYLLINKQAIKNEEIRKWIIGKTDFDYFKMKGADSSMAEARSLHFEKTLAGENVEWIDEHTQNGETKYVLRKMYPLKEDGKLKYVYGYGIDITEVRKAQLQKDEYIQQLEKIAFTTSHRVRQPICNMQGLINLLHMGNFNRNELKELVGCMQNSVQILDDYTKELADKLHEYKQELSVKTSKERE